MSVDYRPNYDPANVDSDYGHTGGDITVPTFNANLKPFRFWCQKALPLVYDDSLSYYEVLCKVVKQMNDFLTDLQTATGAIDQFAQQFVINQQFLNDMADQLGQNVQDLEDYINDRLEDYMTAYTQLQNYVNNYFDNLDVQQEINNKLDDMAEDGTFNTLFDPVFTTWLTTKTAQIDADIASQNSRISVLEGRMDTFSSLPSGSTSGNAELLDIRTNFLGETYPTAGDAVRASDMITSGFQSISATKLEKWDGNNDSSVYDSIQIDIGGYKGGHVAVIGSFKYFQSDLNNTGTCAVYATNTPGKVEDANAVNYLPGITNSIFKNFKQLTTSISGEERLLLQFAIPDDYAYQYLKIGHFEHNALTGSYTEPLYIVYANSWSRTPVDDTLTIAGDAADAKAAGDAINELNERLDNVDVTDQLYNTYSVPPTKKNNDSGSGITFTYKGNNTVNISGQNSSFTFYNMFNIDDLSAYGIRTNDTVVLYVKSDDDTKVFMQLFYKVGSTVNHVQSVLNGYTGYTIPSTATGLLFRIYVAGDNTSKNIDITARILVNQTDTLYFIPTNKYSLAVDNGTDLDTITENGIRVLTSSYSYVNAPSDISGYVSYLITFTSAKQLSQTIVGYGNNTVIYRRDKNINLGTAWTPWRRFSSALRDITTEALGLGDNSLDPVSGSSIDLNSVNRVNKVYLLNDAHTYTNLPTGAESIGFLMCYYTGNWNLQVYYSFTNASVYKRRGNNVGSVWSAWTNISGDVRNITNEYTFNSYENTVTVSATPSITSDTNNYLAPTGDSTDRTADILAMLNSNGICRLGTGNYYVTDLVMPDNSSIIGSGLGTNVILSENGTFAIAPKTQCTVKDLKITGGADGSVTPSATVGSRHGILWQGNYTESETAPFRCILGNLMIANFTGGGITCFDTGYGTDNCIEATNIYIMKCSAGINISYWSEFHKFTNVRCEVCYYGCINNGGNNIFVNCDFSSNYAYGMLMDNSQGQSRNNTHGSCIGCVFNHTANNGVANSGTGIAILNCANGFVFSGCQIFFSKIKLEYSDGVTFANCNFGYVNCDISIIGGGSVLFMGNQHQQKAGITITDNEHVHFVNCYNRSTGALIEP